MTYFKMIGKINRSKIKTDETYVERPHPTHLMDLHVCTLEQAQFTP